jgi:hypothetical protein
MGDTAVVGGAGKVGRAAFGCAPAYCCARCDAAAELVGALATAAADEEAEADGRPKPAAAYLASMSSPMGGKMGVSGGGGEPLVARVVMTDAVESKRLRPVLALEPVPVPGSSLDELVSAVELLAGALAPPPGGAKYCWW